MRGTAGSRSYPIKLHFAVYGGLIVCPLLIVGMLLSNLYVSKERQTLEAGARAIVRDATAAIDRELDRFRNAGTQFHAAAGTYAFFIGADVRIHGALIDQILRGHRERKETDRNQKAQ